MESIKVVVVDDHTLLREGLCRILNMEEDISVIGEAENGHEAIEKACKLKPDIILMDINMPDMNGIDATRKIKENFPNIKIVGLTLHDDDQYVFEMVRAGANGYVLKDVESQELIETIRKVNKGESMMTARITSKLLEEFNRLSSRKNERDKRDELLPQLTQREKEILCLIARGMSNRQIAAELYISEKTVKNHISSLFRKVDVSDRTQAALLAIKIGLVELK